MRMRMLMGVLVCAGFLGLTPVTAKAESLTIVAASDLKFAMEELAGEFRAENPGSSIQIIYGSSGKFSTQIQHGAPFDMYFSADIAYPRDLEAKGLTSGPVMPYATGRIVLWSLRPEIAETPLKDLASTPIRRFAIANPQHAPYGMRAQEAMEHQGVWEMLKPRLVMGENIAHAAQFVESGAAEAGIVALALVLSPTMEGKGAWTLIPDEWHKPLEQGFVITKRGADNRLAAVFSEFMVAEPARKIMRRYGFVLPGEQG